MKSIDRLSLEKILGNVFLFAGLNPVELKLISSFCHVKKLKRNEFLFHEGDDALNFFVLAYGELKVFVTGHNGIELTLHMHKEGDLIAEAAIFSENVYPASCVSLRESLVVFIPKKEFVDLINKKPQVSLKLMSEYSKRMRFFVKQIEELSSMDVKERLVKYILSNAKGNILKLSMSKKDLALILGTSPETLSRTLNFLKKEGLIDINARTIQIKNPDALYSISPS